MKKTWMILIEIGIVHMWQLTNVTSSLALGIELTPSWTCSCQAAAVALYRKYIFCTGYPCHRIVVAKTQDHVKTLKPTCISTLTGLLACPQTKASHETISANFCIVPWSYCEAVRSWDIGWTLYARFRNIKLVGGEFLCHSFVLFFTSINTTCT